MQHHRPLKRSVVLALSLLSACAAAGPSDATSGSTDPHIGGNRSAPPGASSAFLVGRFAAAEGDMGYAADQFLKALATDTGDKDIRRQAFIAALLADRPDAARLAPEETANPDAQLLLADIAARNGDWEAAEQRYAALPRQGLTQLLQPLLLAWAQFGAGHPDTALATLRPLLETDRLRAIYGFHAGLIADLSNRAPEAGRLYHAAQLQLGNGNLDLLRALASWQAREGQTAEARQTLAAVFGMGADLAIAGPRLQAEVATRPVRRATDGIAESYLALAVLLRQQDASEAALVLLRLALGMRPDLTAARLVACELLEQAKHPEAALAVLAPVTASDALAASVELRRAALQDRLGNTDEALRTLGQLAAAWPDRPEPWTLQGDVLRGKRRFADSVAAYDRAVALTGQPTRSAWPLFYERGIAEERSHTWARAEADFERALQLSPEEPSVLNYLGYSWTEQGHQLDRARQMIQRAATARPNDGAILDSLGWVTLRQGDVPGAVKSLEKAVELQPEDPTINGHLGDAYWAAGRKLEARYQWRRALTLSPDPDDVPKLEAKLHNADQTPGAAGPTTAEKTVQ